MTPTALSYLVNAAWQTPVIVALALACGRFSRLQPHALYRLYVTALCAAVVVPAIALDPSFLWSSISLLGPSDQPAYSPLPASYEISVPGRPEPSSGLAINASLTHVILSLAAAVMLLAVVRLVWGLYAAHRLCRRAEPATLDPELDQRLAAFCAARAIAPPRIKVSDRVEGPIASGILAPTIILPVGFLDLDRHQVAAGLLHECAHVARRDFPINLALEIVMLPQSWNPALRLLKSALGRAREAACDAQASEGVGSRAHYAASLVALSSSAMVQRDVKPALALIRAGELERRVRHLLGPVTRPSLARRALASTATAAGVALMPFMHVQAVAAALPAIAANAVPPETVPWGPATSQATTAADSPLPAPALRHDRRSMRRVHPEATSHTETTVLMTDAGRNGYGHEWTGASGRRYHVITESSADPASEEKRRLEGQVDHALAAVDRARPLIESPAFRDLQRRLASGDLQAQIRRATSELNSTRTQLAIARAELFAKSDLARKLGELSARLGDSDLAAPSASPGLRPDVGSPEPKSPSN